MGCIAILLLFDWAVHNSNFHVTSEVRVMSSIIVLRGAQMVFVGQVKSTGGAVEPVVVVLDGMWRIIALSRVGIGAGASATSTVVPSTAVGIRAGM